MANKNENVERYLRFLNERFQAFRDALALFLKTLAQDNRDKKIETASGVLAQLDALKLTISTADRPAWIEKLEGKLRWYSHAVLTVPEAGLQVIETMISVGPEIASQKWDIAESPGRSLIDFSAIYQEFYTNSRVPELFDELVRQLQEIIDSGEIDSLKAIQSLETLIETIKKNARGDFFATGGAWQFAHVFLKNCSLELLENTPGIKHLVKAMRKTMAELNLEFAQVHEGIQRRVAELTRAELPMLQYKPLQLPPPAKDAESSDEAPNS